MSVNLSASQLADEQLPDLLVELLETHRAPAERLLLELTESALMRQATDQPLQMLERLRSTGAGLVLDDFGTGYSSLARLSSLRLAAVKIDRSFIAAMEADVGARAVVTAVMQMAGPLGCAVVAEGIETESQRDLLLALGCPRAQGYLFGRPAPVDEATADARTRRGHGRPGDRLDPELRSEAVPVLGITKRPSRAADPLAVDDDRRAPHRGARGGTPRGRTRGSRRPRRRHAASPVAGPGDARTSSR